MPCRASAAVAAAPWMSQSYSSSTRGPCKLPDSLAAGANSGAHAPSCAKAWGETRTALLVAGSRQRGRGSGVSGLLLVACERAAIGAMKTGCERFTTDIEICVCIQPAGAPQTQPCAAPAQRAGRPSSSQPCLRHPLRLPACSVHNCEMSCRDDGCPRAPPTARSTGRHRVRRAAAPPRSAQSGRRRRRPAACLSAAAHPAGWWAQCRPAAEGWVRRPGAGLSGMRGVAARCLQRRRRHSQHCPAAPHHSGMQCSSPSVPC